MSFFDYLDRVRARPLEDRKRLLVVWTGLLMTIIAGLWIVNTLWVLGPVTESGGEVATTSSEVGTTQSDSPVTSASWRNHVARVRVGLEAVTAIVKDQVSGEE